jgi:hypothetical protein
MRLKGIAAAQKWFQGNMSQESTAPDASAFHLGTVSKHSPSRARLCPTQPLRKPAKKLANRTNFVGSSILRVAVAEARSSKCHPTGLKTWQQHIDPRAAVCSLWLCRC